MTRACILAILILLSCAINAHGDTAGKVIDEINVARTNPERYVEYLRSWRTRYVGHRIKLSDNHYMLVQEDVRSVDEAIEFMKNRKPIGPLVRSKGLDKAASEMVSEQGRTGQTGHMSPDGLRVGERASHYGRWVRIIGEDIVYGIGDPRTIVLMWIIDDGVPKRDHRANIFDPEFKVAGAATGPHKRYRVMCVVDFAGGFVSKRKWHNDAVK